jgi:hypothetical protein
MALSVAEAGVVLARLMGGLVFDDSDSDDVNYTETPSLGPFPTGAHDHKAGGSGATIEDTLPTHASLTNLCVYATSGVEYARTISSNAKRIGI